MIGKKAPNPKKSSTKAGRVTGLTNYITAPENANSLEKCVHYEASNFLTDDLQSQQVEMIALATTAVRSKDPIDHYVLSWQEGEKPTIAQVREAVEMTMKHLGLEGHQVVWGLHDDTDNMHVHIAINRVHPETLQIVEVNKGFQNNAIQQAAAIVEKVQGWKVHDKARFKTDELGHLITDSKTKLPKVFKEEEKKEPTGQAKDKEIQTGEKSAQRIGIENAPAIIASATSWADLHTKMQAAGMEYTRQGSGAAIKIGNTVVKASDVVDRKNNFGALQKRLGIYQSSNQPEIKNDPLGRTQLITDDRFSTGYDQPHTAPTGFSTFDTLRDLPRSNLDVTNTTNRQASKNQNLLQPHESSDNRRIERVRRGSDSNSSERGSARSRGTSAEGRTIQGQDDQRTGNQGLRIATANGRNSSELNGKLLRQPLNKSQTGWTQYIQIRDDQKAAKTIGTIELQKRHAAERAALQAKLKAEREKAMAGSWKGKGPERNAAQSVLATVQAAERLELSEQQNAERKALQARFKPLPMYKKWNEQPQILGENLQQELQIIRAKQPPKLSQILKSLTYSTDMRGHVTYAQHGKSVFRDEGRTIQVLDLESDDGIAAALATAQQKFGQVLTLTGTPEFQKNAVAVAVANNLTCRFADPALDKLREQLQQQKYHAEREANRAPEKAIQSPPSEAVAPALPPSNKTAQRGIDPAQEQQMQRAMAARAVVKEAKQKEIDDKAKLPETPPVVALVEQTPIAAEEDFDYDPGQEYSGDEHDAQAEAAEAQKIADAEKAAEEHRLSEPVQLADIQLQIAAIKAEANPDSLIHSKPVVQATEEDHAKAASGEIMGSNETFVAVSLGREIKIYRVQELTKQVEYDGIASGHDRFANGNKIEIKPTKTGANTVVREEREAMQTEVRRARARDKRLGR